MADHNKDAPCYIMIAGPTASGKSQFAIELAKNMNGAIINADSMQLYADLSILTARPQPKDLAMAPHHLFGVFDASQRASVAVWLDAAATALDTVRRAGQLPIIVGGTGMYLQAGLRGIAPVPDVPDAIHQQAVDLHKTLGPQKFRDALTAHDAELAARLVDGDSQRLIRAMGVALATDRPLSWWQKQPHKGAFLGSAVTLAMVPPRPTLYDQINRRFDMMFDNGALDEVERLMARQLDPNLPLMKALGVAPLAAFLRGDISADDAKYTAKRDSRRYAKRQMTWIRNNFNAQIEIEKKYSESLFEKIFSLIR